MASTYVCMARQRLDDLSWQAAGGTVADTSSGEILFEIQIILHACIVCVCFTWNYEIIIKDSKLLMFVSCVFHGCLI